MEVKYTAEDLHVAFVTARYFAQAQAGTPEESWKRNVAKARRDVAGNRSGFTTAQVERFFDAAKAAENQS